MKNRTLLIAAGAAFLLASCGHKEESKEVAPVRVETMTVGKSSVEAGRTYAGTIEESSGTVLSFKIPGTIRSINVSEGQRVQKGQLIGMPRHSDRPRHSRPASRSSNKKIKMS